MNTQDPADGTNQSAQRYQNIRVETRERVGLITLDRPKALNALNAQTMRETVAAVQAFDADRGIGTILLTGSERAFAAGADIKEMASQDYADVYLADWFADWDGFTRVRKPIVAAVSGYALGGGCELAMMCDVLIAADTAQFGQPEIDLGVLPGMGGSQRLTRAVGKAKAMDMILTGRRMDAAEAERSGLVSRVVPADELLDRALEVAATISTRSLPAALAAKEAVNAAFETTLAQGVLFERRAFHAAFATEDQKEGMAAFAQKRQAEFKHR
ncbi:enoyl-CoA hydratase [Kocuria coralli]|uniref:Probable enoyl-CoA hydratase echA8 n=1 Tax=Kocuria coralli TaxID=1461025 RepID=A0A5J5KWB5_9MICC|nr:enoyl-CoA hydratase [Kocuria coralli]KAA9393904.1 enoyl-CoA hydratase [Kocuria coralli]